MKALIVYNTSHLGKKEKIVKTFSATVESAIKWIEENAEYVGPGGSLHYCYSIIDLETMGETVPFNRDYVK